MNKKYTFSNFIVALFTFCFLVLSNNAFAQLKQEVIGSLSGVIPISLNHPSYSFRSTFVSSQSYTVANLNPTTDVLFVAFQNTASNPETTVVFRVTNITVVSGQQIDILATSVRGSTTTTLGSTGVLYKSKVTPNDIGLIDSTIPDDLKAGVINHNFLLLDSLVSNVSSSTRDTIQTLTYTNDTLLINDGGLDKKVEIIASESGLLVTQAAHTKQLGDVVTLNGSTLADTTANGANLAAFYVSKIIDVNSYEVRDNGILDGLTRNGQTLTDNTDYYLGNSNELISTLPTSGMKQKILSTSNGKMIFDIAEYAFPLGDASPTSSLTGTDNQTLRFNGTTLEATSNLLGFSDGSYTIGNTVNNPSAVLDVLSLDKGVLLPRMTTAQRDAIATPTTSLLIFNTTTGQFEFFDGTNWTALGTKTERLRSVFVDSDFPLAGNNFTAEELTIPSYLDGWTLTAAYYATNIPSDQNYQININNEVKATNYSSQTMTANVTTATQTALGFTVNTGDRLRIFIDTLAGSIPNGLEVIFEFTQP